jgi:hypothetical protein
MAPAARSEEELGPHAGLLPLPLLPPAVRLQASGGRRYREGSGPAAQTSKRIGIREGGCAS